MDKLTLRERATCLFEGKHVEMDNHLIEFEKYLEAYCAELKLNEWDVLRNDEVYDQVFNIFSSIFNKKTEEIFI
jgi:hypothetical protein